MCASVFILKKKKDATNAWTAIKTNEKADKEGIDHQNDWTSCHEVTEV